MNALNLLTTSLYVAVLLGNVGNALASPISSEDVLFARQLAQESGGRQFSAPGVPLISPKGAIGVAQVMPGTAPEAARLAGMEWSEWKYKNDADYNKALGLAYINAQLEKYTGNYVLALAAYNAGPGSVDIWLKKFGDPRDGDITNNDFVHMIPYAETKDYVSNILKINTSTLPISSVVNSTKKSALRKFEFKDSHPSFKFGFTVRRTFNTEATLVGGL
nr:transglycosylase SLT domain-containing protein [Pectobacterium carotovorum]